LGLESKQNIFEIWKSVNENWGGTAEQHLKKSANVFEDGIGRKLQRHAEW
jgi:hypothetical protein